MRTAGIVAGIVLALRIAQYVGAPLAISAKPMALGLLNAQFAGAACIAALPPIECPSSVAGSVFIAPSVSSTSAAMLV